MADILIRGGTVIDGSGAPAYAADVRVSAGLITEIGRALAARAGETVHDASGCYVTPGFIEAHTHYDATMWSEPDLAVRFRAAHSRPHSPRDDGLHSLNCGQCRTGSGVQPG